MEDLLLVGFGGHAKSVADCIERHGKYHIAGYTDVKRCECKYEYLGSDEVFQSVYDSGVKNAAIVVGYMGKNDIRKSLYEKMKKIGFEFPVIVDPSSIISESASIGEGTFVGKNAVINSDAVVGRMAIINTGSIVEHECIVGDYAHVAVGAVLCGKVSVGTAAFVGANATVIQCRKVEDYEIIPAGATIR
ncbi:MAG: NeuD/PglB/VioB family sugar acetyltransferase [Coprococcus sp.]|nr:NeuD/PglB/VioB family sugar acetyltransferase [Coprococcus sp.]